MGNSTTPTQKNSELGQLSALTFQLHSRPPPTPSLLNPTGSCGVDRRPVSVSIWLSLSLLPLLSAVHWGSPRLEGLLIPISPLDTGPAMNLRESRGESLCSGRGYGEGRRRAVGREEKEKRKEKETNQKRLGRIGVGQRGGGGNEEEQTEMEWGALIQFGSFLIFPIHSPAFSLLCQLSEMLCLTGSLSQISYHLKPLGSERWRPRKGSKWVYQCFFTPRELLDTKGKGIKDLKRAQKRESSL